MSFFISLATVLVSSVVIAQDKAVLPQVEMLTMKVLVMDTDGNPLEGATVSPRGLRTKQEPGSHWGWREDPFGKPPKVTTGTDGIAEVPYPKYVMEKLEVGEVTLLISHPDFVTFDGDRNVDDTSAEVRLDRGFRIAVNAVDASTGEKIKDNLYAAMSGFSTEPWKLFDNGMLVSPVYKKHTGQLRVVQIVDGKAVLFSERLEIEPDDSSRILLKDVKMFPGYRLTGRLDDSVPRPVDNGSVVARIARMGSDAVQRWENTWHWADHANITPDGVFVFECLPPGEVVQLIALCDGHVSKCPTDREIAKYFPLEANNGVMQLPQLFLLDDELGEIELKMESTSSVQIKLVDPEGVPIEGGNVNMWPNMYFFNVGSTVLGESYISAEMLVHQRLEKEPTEDHKRFVRFLRVTDEKGIAIIDNLPTDRSHHIVAKSDEYEMPISGNHRWATVDVKANEVAEITIQMQRKGTDHLGSKPADDDTENTDDEDSNDNGG
ncbi:MAG: hypothetical protein R3C03_16615 [Pirellulaceae bacterium]